MIVGPSMPTPITSRIPGTLAREISWLQMTCSIGPSPWPPYSFGQVTPARPALGELALPGAAGGDDLVLVLERARALQDRALRLVLVQPAAHLGAVGGLLGCVVQIHVASFG